MEKIFASHTLVLQPKAIPRLVTMYTLNKISRFGFSFLATCLLLFRCSCFLYMFKIVVFSARTLEHILESGAGTIFKLLWWDSSIQ